MDKKLKQFDHILENDLMRELDSIIAAGTISPSQVKTVTDAICLMLKSKEYEEWLKSESDDPGSSFRRGRSSMTGRYISRDPGYYMDDRYSGGSNGRDAYDIGYSGHSIKDRMVAKLETMVDMAKSDYERQKVLEAIQKIESIN